ncbi:MAG: M48 family metallopeptidase [Lachnospiraceae bacterium]|nr:M48 family metallopeptidase [Lachnospiraceae bacterium]
MAKDEILFYLDTKEGKIPCYLKRTRRKTYGVVVDKDARVELRMPLRGSRKKALEMAEEWREWILEKRKIQLVHLCERQKLIEEGEKRFSPQSREQIEKKYRKAAREYITARVAYYTNILGVHCNSIRIAEQKTRWGSCSGNGTLSFHWKLMFAPRQVLDYVIVHEVCHLKEMNHSKRFWAWVSFLMPGYEENRKWLKDHGEQLQYY